MILINRNIKTLLALSHLCDLFHILITAIIQINFHSTLVFFSYELIYHEIDIIFVVGEKLDFNKLSSYIFSYIVQEEKFNLFLQLTFNY